MYALRAKPENKQIDFGCKTFKQIWQCTKVKKYTADHRVYFG